jgi:hypothetical protein
LGVNWLGLAAVPDPVPIEGRVFTALAEEGEDRHENLNGQEDQEDVHACIRALRSPASSGWQVVESRNDDGPMRIISIRFETLRVSI